MLGLLDYCFSFRGNPRCHHEMAASLREGSSHQGRREMLISVLLVRRPNWLRQYHCLNQLFSVTCRATVIAKACRQDHEQSLNGERAWLASYRVIYFFAHANNIIASVGTHNFSHTSLRGHLGLISLLC
jgi:hypothetical protein